MKIIRVAWTPFSLALRKPLQTGSDCIRERQGYLVELETDTGILGLGEASPLESFGTESLTEVAEALQRIAPFVLGANLQDAESVLDKIATSEPSARSTQGALDLALHDALARSKSRPLAEELAEAFGSQASKQIEVNALLSGTSVEEVRSQATRCVAEGYATLKLKVGSRSIADDFARVAAVRDAAGNEVSIRLDANAAWSFTEALNALETLAPLNIEFIEQPVSANDLASLAKLRAQKLIPIAADEAACSVQDARHVLDAKAADLLILKPGLNGGLQSSLVIARAAQSEGIPVVVTTSLDSALGATAALHLAAALNCEKACGLATGALFEDDLAEPLAPVDGRLGITNDAGLGIELDRTLRDHLAMKEREESRLQ